MWRCKPQRRARICVQTVNTAQLDRFTRSARNLVSVGTSALDKATKQQTVATVAARTAVIQKPCWSISFGEAWDQRLLRPERGICGRHTSTSIETTGVARLGSERILTIGRNLSVKCLRKATKLHLRAKRSKSAICEAISSRAASEAERIP